jgi:5'-3' exonuclease
LYLDLNGVIHNATHSNDPKKLERISKAKDFEVIWAEVIQYIDDIIHLVKPREMCMFAVDGVAPRAKMNQQRSRRFKTAQERHELKKLADDALIDQDADLDINDMFDVNSISPGTDFMTELNEKLDYFIQHKVNTDPLYSKMKIILSGSDVPGEGEHKIMEYIRWYKNSDVYKKDTRHCIYGQDADLIMLSLLSHEPNFTIIREEVKYKREQVEGIVRNEFIITNNFQMLYLPILRQYLDLEFKDVLAKTSIEYNLERVIDDIIFLCFFVGNDFLPSLSVLDIAEASVDTLFQIYKKVLPDINDYITENGLIYWNRAEKLIKELASHELSILHSRMQKIMNFERRAENQESQFFKGAQRIQYFRLKEKQSNMILAKKKKLLERLVKEGKDAEYKKNLVSNKPRELVRMKLDVKEKAQKLKKRRANNPNKYKTDGKGVDFTGFDQESEEEEDDDWLEEDYRNQAEDDEEEINRNAEPEREPKTEPEKTQAQPQEPPKEESKEESKEETIDTSKADPALEGIVDAKIDLDNLSDLDIKDFNDSDVSDVDLEELIEIEEGVQGSLTKDMIVQLKLAEESRKKNQDFVKNLCLRYKENPDSAKAYYYKEKVNFDVYVPAGKEQRDDMLRQYLIGMQWVLFYYYKGVQHWGFYYKYHYPPMISDIKDVETLLGQSTVENFDECKSSNSPFKPFQQLLTILPPDSIKNLLPKCYSDHFVGNPDFEQFYPLTFDMDLNGRSMPWEAIVLIPFIDETVLLDFEAKLAEEGKLQMEQKDIHRNSMGVQKLYFKEMKLGSFPIPEPQFKGFEFGNKNRCKIVEQPTENDDHIGVNFIDFAKTETHVVHDFPSIRNLEIEKASLQTRALRGTRFEIPQIFVDDSWTKEFDIRKLALQFVNRKTDRIFIDYPFQREAFIYCIITPEEYYHVYGCYEQQSAKHLVSPTSEQQWFEGSMHASKAMTKFNIHCTDLHTIVGFNRVKSVKWNNRSNTFEKDYVSEVEYLPLQMVMMSRDDAHYLNLEPRIADPLSRFEPMKKCMLFDQIYYGLTAQIKGVNEEEKVSANFKYYDVTINNKKEQAKIRDLFFAKNIIRSMMTEEPKYSSIDHMAKRNHKTFQVINRITSSIFIKFTDEDKERKTVDIGLKLRNGTQKLHIPMDVIYDEKPNNKYPGATTQFWGFSEIAEETIMEYLHTFPWIEHYVEQRAHHESSMRNQRGGGDRMNTLEDAMPFIETHEERLLELKRLTDWLDGCELSNRSFVPAGFRFISKNARDAIEDKLAELKQKEGKEIPALLEKVDPRSLFSEQFPFWTPPYHLQVKNFRFGDRVINIDTQKRKYVPFGEIGTVIGQTIDGVIVRFDEPNVTLTDVHDTCPPYTGAVVNPSSIVNLTFNAELKIQHKKTQNIRQAHGQKPAGAYSGPNYRQQPGFNKKSSSHGSKGGHGSKEEQKQGPKGPTRYGGYNPKKGKPRHGNDWGQ